jgi:hypothetical protein
MRKVVLLAIVLSFLAAACRVESNVILTLEADRSGTYTVEFGMDEELRQAVAGFGGLGDDGEAIDPLEGFEIDDPSVETSRRTDGDMEFVVATSTFEDVDELTSLLDTAQDSGIGELDITYEGDTVAVRGVLAGTGNLNAEGLGDLGGFGDLGDLSELGGLGLDPSVLVGDFFSAALVVAMPGEVTEHNASTVRSDGSLQWDLTSEESTVIAVSDTSAASFPWGIIAVAVVLLFAVGFGLWVGRRRQNASVQAIQQAQAAAGPDGGNEAGATDDPFGRDDLV